MPTWIITGSNRGLGLEFVRQLSSIGEPNTIIAAVRSLSGELDDLRALTERSTNGSTITILECDTASISSIQAFGKTCTPLIKDKKIDFLINNAAINGAAQQDSLTLEAADLHQHIDVNVLGPAETVKVLAPHLSQKSLVVNMTSGLGSAGKGLVKCTVYAISKAAINMLTVHQAGNLAGQGTRVICQDPGWVKTRMGGSGAIITPEESISGMLKVFRTVVDGKDGGEVGKAKFYLYDGTEVPW